MALQHLQFFAVFQADNIIRRHRFLHRYRRLRPLSGALHAAHIGQRPVYVLNELRQIGHGERIVAHMGGHDFRGQLQ